jgi:hypothetical protein
LRDLSVLCNARQNQHGNVTRPARAAGIRRRRQCRARCHHIIHNQDGPPGDAMPPLRMQRQRAAQRGETVMKARNAVMIRRRETSEVPA